MLAASIHHGTDDLEKLVEMARDTRADLLSVPELTPSAAERLDRLGLNRLLPYSVLSTRRGASGAGLYARYPLHRLKAPDFDFKMPRATMFLPSGMRVLLVCAHPQPPTRPSWVDAWKRALQGLPEPGVGAMRVVAGDVNATLDHSEFRDLLDRGYRDAADARGDGLIPTWPSGGSLLPPPITIDHVLVDERGGVENYAVHDLPGSDHDAVYAELALGPE